jgi:hypothetical protein
MKRPAFTVQDLTKLTREAQRRRVAEILAEVRARLAGERSAPEVL